jgi:hypothetical protein
METTMSVQKTLLAATVAAVALLSAPEPAHAQSGDPILRFLNAIFPNAEFRSASGSRSWDDDDDDDDDDGGRSGRYHDDDDDDDDGGRDDNDDDD